ncbi:MAG: VCBS repeat-containing protein [Alphaproteobacteria bacterium]|nr:VCBS repeat-containing protein [Alphaproteobacteria bacterium]
MCLRAPVAALIIALILHGSTFAAGAGPQPVEVGRVPGLQDILLRGSAVLVRAAAGDYEIVALPDGKLALAPIPPAKQIPVPSDIIPHAAIVPGALDIKAAWLAGPTGRYEHGVLGDAIEAAALKVETGTGKILSYQLPPYAVFEDLTPRLADLDGDGRDEIVVVRSYEGTGAAVAVLGIRDDRLDLVAESPAIGQARRWLNPVGIGDFDGDGRKEIAVVQTPHIGGVLMLYRIDGNRLVEFARKAGYSTHAIGSTVLGMAAVLDLDGDGADDILLPDQTRRELFAIGYAGGTFRVLWTVPNREQIVTSVVIADVDGNGVPDILYGLGDGSVRMLPR